MKHILREAFLGDFPEVEISAEEYNSYKAAKETLQACFEVEERYEILISNYMAYEKKISELSVKHMIKDKTEYMDFFEDRLALNVCIINLLTASRLYVDQIPQYVKYCVKTVTNENIKAIFAQQYDKNFDYRFMEALRNHVQHCGLPIHFVSFNSRWTDDKLMEFSIILSSKSDMLREGGGFKKKVLEEIKDEVDLVNTTRGYIESLSYAHDEIRGLISAVVSDARIKLEEAHNKYSQFYRESLHALTAYITYDGQQLLNPVELFLDWDDVRVKLQNRNRKLVNLKKRHVTSKMGTYKKKH